MRWAIGCIDEVDQQAAAWFGDGLRLEAIVVFAAQVDAPETGFAVEVISDALIRYGNLRDVAGVHEVGLCVAWPGPDRF